MVLGMFVISRDAVRSAGPWAALSDRAANHFETATLAGAAY